LVISGRHPARAPPLSAKVSADTITAVSAKSTHTGRTDAWIESLSQTRGQITTEMAVPSRTANLPSSHRTDPITGADTLAFTNTPPALPMLAPKLASRPVIQLTAKPF